VPVVGYYLQYIVSGSSRVNKEIDMSDQPVKLTPQQAGVVKVAAAMWYKEQGLRPATADYIFTRFMRKRAIEAGMIPKPSTEKRDKAMKLASAIKPIVDKVKATRKA